MTEPGPMTWLLLALQLPAQPAYLRVKVWRRLQGVGAISYRNALYVLPASESSAEDFEWILREVRASGGEGAVFESRSIEGASDLSLRALFDAARERDYLELAEELRATMASAEFQRSDAEPSDSTQAVARIRRRLKLVESIDFFNASGRETVHALLRKLEMRSPTTSSEAVMTATTAPEQPRGRTWVTRAQVRVDRMASAWLIRRWIDPEAKFKFVHDRLYRPIAQELRFDMFEAEYTHDGERCTFEVLLELIPAKDEALKAISQIVHDLDIKDDKYGRPETAGIQQLLSGIIANCPDDADRLRRAATLFDDLYRSFTDATR